MYIALILFVVILVAALLSARLRVDEACFAVIERLGKFQKVLPPGTHFIVPVIDKAACLLATTKQEETFKLQVPMDTGTVLHITFSLQWQLLPPDAKQIVNAAYLFRDPAQRTEVIHTAARTAVSGFFANRSLSVSIPDYEALSQILKSKLGSLLETMGYELKGLQLKDLYPG